MDGAACEEILHELFHWTGLKDEYIENDRQRILGVKTRVGQENCRHIGTPLSLMSNQEAASILWDRRLIPSLLMPHQVNFVIHGGCKPENFAYMQCIRFANSQRLNGRACPNAKLVRYCEDVMGSRSRDSALLTALKTNPSVKLVMAATDGAFEVYQPKMMEWLRAASATGRGYSHYRSYFNYITVHDKLSAADRAELRRLDEKVIQSLERNPNYSLAEAAALIPHKIVKPRMWVKLTGASSAWEYLIYRSYFSKISLNNTERAALKVPDARHRGRP